MKSITNVGVCNRCSRCGISQEKIDVIKSLKRDTFPAQSSFVANRLSYPVRVTGHSRIHAGILGLCAPESPANDAAYVVTAVVGQTRQRSAGITL